MSEQLLQRSIVTYLRAVLPSGFIVQSTANKPRSKVAGAIEKSMGAVKGWPDLTLYGPANDGKPYAWFIEVKTRTGRVSPDQHSVHDRLRDIGFPVEVARSLDDVRAFIAKHNLPSRDANRSAA